MVIVVLRTKQPESVVSTPISRGVFPNLKPFTTTVAPCGMESIDICRENKSLSSELHAASKMPAKKHEIDAVFFIFLPFFTPKKDPFLPISDPFLGFYFCFFRVDFGNVGLFGLLLLLVGWVFLCRLCADKCDNCKRQCHDCRREQDYCLFSSRSRGEGALARIARFDHCANPTEVIVD